MSTKNNNSHQHRYGLKKKIFIYCEGESERNYFEALKGNWRICEYYVLVPNSNLNDLDGAIKKSQRMGIDVLTLYVYDADTFRRGYKRITELHERYKDYIYLSDENFEDFLRCHQTKAYYRDRKPHLSRQLIEEVRNFDCEYVYTHLKRPHEFGEFKSLYTLLIELFERRL